MIYDYTNIPSPAYILDINAFDENLAMIDRIQKAADVSFIPALKGFALWKIFPRMKPFVRGAAASGLYESRLIFEEMGVKAHTYSPAFSADDLSEIVKYSSHITFNSIAQFNNLSLKVNVASCGIRVNPGYSPVKTTLYNPASPGSRLGISPNEIIQIEDKETLEGLHFHVLCESSADESINAISSFEAYFSDQLRNGGIKWVNFGGGHLVTREGYNTSLLIEGLCRFRTRYPDIQVFLEPGSAYAWNAGVLRTKVVDVVSAAGIDTAILDVSFTAHMPDCLEMPYQPEVIGADILSSVPSVKAEKGYRYRLGGCSCLAGDWVGDWLFPEKLKPGDDVVFTDMIHYTMVKTTMFNGVKHPAIGIYENGTYTSLKEFSFDDYKNRLS